MHSSSLRAITTRYKGYAFRSRLEARWAVFFDSLGIRWEYEPEGYELGNGLRYLPDFWLPDWNMWVEVKPGAPEDVAREKAFRLALHSGASVFIACGMPDNPGTLCATHTHSGGECTLLDLPAIVSWTTRLVVIPSDGLPGSRRKYDQQMGFSLMARTKSMTAERCLKACVDKYQPALEAARGARFEQSDKGAA